MQQETCAWAFPIRNGDAKRVVQKVNELGCTFGFLKITPHDGGTYFMNKAFATFSEVLRITRKHGLGCSSPTKDMPQKKK